MSHRYHPDENSAPPNKFGIANLADLQRIETPLALRRLLELQRNPIRGHFDTEHLCAIHRYMFGDVYEWAGELRSVNISKPGAIFPPPEYLRPNLDKLLPNSREKNSSGICPRQHGLIARHTSSGKSTRFIRSAKETAERSASLFANWLSREAIGSYGEATHSVK
jgi:cell filamentation protein